MPPENNTCFPFPQQLSQLPQSTESEAGGWGGESYKEIRESLTSLGRSMGCFTRQMEKDQHYLSFICSHTLRAACSAATVDSLSGCHGVVNVGYVALLVFEGAALFSFVLNCHNMFLNLNLFCTDGAWSLGKWTSLNWFIKFELGYEKRYSCAALIPNTHFKKFSTQCQLNRHHMFSHKCTHTLQLIFRLGWTWTLMVFIVKCSCRIFEY